MGTWVLNVGGLQGDLRDQKFLKRAGGLGEGATEIWAENIPGGLNSKHEGLGIRCDFLSFSGLSFHFLCESVSSLITTLGYLLEKVEF